MKYTVTLGGVTQTAYEAHDRDFLKFGDQLMSKKKLKALGFRLQPERDAGAIVKFMARKTGMSEQEVIDTVVDYKLRQEFSEILTEGGQHD